MLLFVDYIATKQIIAPALNNIVGGPSKLFEATAGNVIPDGDINSVAQHLTKELPMGLYAPETL
jgi:hypothetical protein